MFDLATPSSVWEINFDRDVLANIICLIINF